MKTKKHSELVQRAVHRLLRIMLRIGLVRIQTQADLGGGVYYTVTAEIHESEIPLGEAEQMH